MKHTTDSLENMLKTLCLKAFLANHQKLAEESEREELSYFSFLKNLSQLEIDIRHQRRISSLLKQSKLPRDKHLRDFKINNIKGLSKSLIHRLAEGVFIDRSENILIFGNPGTGKTHLAMALAREWCLLGRKVLFKTAAAIVQELLQAKRDLELNKIIKKLDKFEILIIDDISYVPYSVEEKDVLFTLLSERYEQRSILITSNLVFSKWDRIFKDEMTTTAAIDRLVHHSTILELNTKSFRAASAEKAKKLRENTEENCDLQII